MESLRGQVFRAVGYMCTHEGERMLIWECGRGSPLDGVESRSTSQKREQRTLASFSTSSKRELGGRCLDLTGWGQAHSLNHPHWIHMTVLIHSGQNFQLVPSEGMSQLQRPYSTLHSRDYTVHLPYALMLGHQTTRGTGTWVLSCRLHAVLCCVQSLGYDICHQILCES